MGLFKRISSEVISAFKAKFRDIESELTDHLESINSNTNEIQSLYELIADVDQKIDKLSMRIDELQLKLKASEKQIYDVRVQPLTQREKEVFFALYTEDVTTYKQLARKCNMEEVMVQEYLTNLIAKGVPISKKFQNNLIFVSLDEEFKELQAKEQVIKFS